MNQGKKLRVAVLMGGPSREHEVSLKSGNNVARNLDKDKYEALKILIDKDGEWEIESKELKNYADLAFIALHGTFGEDGAVQDILESHEIPYTGSSIGVSALGMNKFLSLRYFNDAGLIVPPTFFVTKNELLNDTFPIFKNLEHRFGYPIVLKPNNQGSSFGVSIVKHRDEMIDAFANIFSFANEAIAQPYIAGREMTCAVLDYGFKESAYALLPTEIIPRVSHFFDYASKYEIDGSDEITPPQNLPHHAINALKRVALAAHRLIGARSFSRTDMILGKNNNIFVLEINTIPGLTEESLLPQAALASGLSFSKLLDKIIESAFGR